MSVLVIGQNGRALMPTTTRKARILLKENKASVVCRHPFTIHLRYKTGCATQEGSIGIDTGSQYIGVGVTCGNKVILKDEHELRSSMEKRSLMETRATMRRGRRYRKVRYRKPKWRHHTKRMYFEKENRKGQHWRKVKTTTQSPRPKGWSPPSLQSKCDHHFRIIDRYLKYLPDSITKNLVIEVGRFDMARMNDLTIHGEMYQRGPMYISSYLLPSYENGYFSFDESGSFTKSGYYSCHFTPYDLTNYKTVNVIQVCVNVLPKKEEVKTDPVTPLPTVTPTVKPAEKPSTGRPTVTVKPNTDTVIVTPVSAVNSTIAKEETTYSATAKKTATDHRITFNRNSSSKDTKEESDIEIVEIQDINEGGKEEKKNLLKYALKKLLPMKMRLKYCSMTKTVKQM